MNRTGKIQYHPDKEAIISRLMEGESVRSIHKWLEQKYGKVSRHNRVSIPTLQAFRKETLKLEGKVLDDIIAARKKREAECEVIHATEVTQASNAYKEKINSIADKTLDVASRIVQMDAVVGERIEHWYNLIKSGKDLPPKADYELRKFVDQQLMVLQQYRKLVEGMADKRVDYNVNITVMNEQIQTIQSVIRDLICEELGPEKAIDFLDKLSNRLGAGQEVKALPAKILDVTHEAE